MDNALLKTELDTLLNTGGCRTAVLVKELGADIPLYERDSETRLVSASVIKVPVMLTVFDFVKKNRLSAEEMIPVRAEDILNDTTVFENGAAEYSLTELVYWMITVSDNTAANVLIRVVGMDAVNAYAESIPGVCCTRLERYMLDYAAIEAGRNNYTSHGDMYRIYSALFEQRILTPELCEKAIAFLRSQRCRDMLKRHVADDFTFAHKTGGLPGLIHDSGVADIGGRHFYIGASVYGSGREESDPRLMGNIGSTVYRALS